MDFFISNGELCLTDPEHTFERGNLSRAAYRHMCAWIQGNFDPKLSPEENWAMAQAAWDSLTPELQGHLHIMSSKEVQNGDDIRQGLLATLTSYQGAPFIKDLFESAIRCVDYK
jgi:hypothetical protein